MENLDRGYQRGHAAGQDVNRFLGDQRRQGLTVGGLGAYGGLKLVTAARATAAAGSTTPRTDYGYYGKGRHGVRPLSTSSSRGPSPSSTTTRAPSPSAGPASPRSTASPWSGSRATTCDMDDIEDAAYHYVHTSRVGGDMHRRSAGDDPVNKGEDKPHKVSDMVESMVFTDEKIAKMGLPEDFPARLVGRLQDPRPGDLGDGQKGEADRLLDAAARASAAQLTSMS